MRITKVGLGDAGRMRFFIDKEKAAHLVGDIAEQMVVATATAFVAKFTITREITAFFLHGILQC